MTYSYDADGRLLTAGNSAGTYTFSYDYDGRLTTVQEPFGLTLTFSYDDAGNRTLVTDSQGATVASSYDADNQLLSEVLSGTGLSDLRINLVYDGDGNVIAETRYSDGVGGTVVGTTTESYNAEGMVTSILNQDGSGNSIGNYAYTYDGADQLIRELDDSTTASYSYDAAGQLLSTNGGTYSYDATGNRTMTGYSVGPDNQLLSDGTWNYTYDAEGNETQKVNIATGETWTYGYDALNELTWAEDHASAGGAALVHVDYTYDVFGNRLEKDVTVVGPNATATTRYAYDGWNPAKAGSTGNSAYDVWATFDGTGSLTTRYVDGDALDQVFARVDASGTEWLYTDHLGSVRAVTDGSGTLLANVGYDAFGNVTSSYGPTPGALGMYQWTGQVFDSETGFYQMRAREFDPSTGRWLSQDPIGFDAGDSNLYRYVKNDPTNATDPSGNVLLCKTNETPQSCGNT